MPSEKAKNEGIAVSVKLPSELVRDLDKIAERDSRTRSGTVRLVLVDFVQNWKAGTKAGEKRQVSA